jgi:hypothetical protein
MCKGQAGGSQGRAGDLWSGNDGRLPRCLPGVLVDWVVSSSTGWE